MSTQWYYQSDGYEFGPVSSSELKRAAFEEKIDGNTPVRKGTSAQWVSASHVKGLFAEPDQPTPQSDESLEGFLGSVSAAESKPNALESPAPIEPAQSPATTLSAVAHGPHKIVRSNKSPTWRLSGFWGSAAVLSLGVAIGVAGTLVIGSLISPNDATGLPKNATQADEQIIVHAENSRWVERNAESIPAAATRELPEDSGLKPVAVSNPDFRNVKWGMSKAQVRALAAH